MFIGAGTCERIRVDNTGLYINNSLFTGGGGSTATPTSLGIVFGYTTGLGNSSIGCCAGNITQTGSNNTAIGCLALLCNTTGSNNIAIGCCSLYNSNATGNNIAIGYDAGKTLTTGINNTIIGSLTAAAGCVCTLLIGAGTCERIRVDNTGLYVNNTLLTGGGSAGPTGPTGPSGGPTGPTGPSGPSGASGVTTGKAIAMAMVFG